MLVKSIFWSIAFGLICLFGCRAKQECPGFNRPEHSDKQVDSVLAKQAAVFRDTLLNRFGETPIKGLNYKAYHLLFYSSHGYGESIKFEINDYGCFLTVKCIKKGDYSPECQNYKTKITEEEWNELNAMIYEFDFWTAEPFRKNEDVLDGYILFLEGNKPEAAICDQRTYQFVGRSSPRFDKMEALCEYIREYKEHLVFMYSQR
ncbi:MAG: hypothetical protein ACKV1O_13040 [Saprospiraceae bacterium]